MPDLHTRDPDDAPSTLFVVSPIPDANEKLATVPVLSDVIIYEVPLSWDIVALFFGMIGMPS